MSNEQFDLVFSGGLVKGFDLAKVKKNLQGLFRISEAQVEKLFTGADVSLKKGLDAETANKYRVAMKKVGAQVNVVLCEAPAASNQQQAPKAAPASPVQTSANSAQAEAAFDTKLGAQPDKPQEPRATINAPDYEVTQSGEDLLKPDEKRQWQEALVDVSHITVREQAGNLVSDEEQLRQEPLEIDIPQLDVADAGDDLLKPQERQAQPKSAVDISHLTLGEVGEDLGPKKGAQPPPPNVDHISIEQ